MQQRKNFVTESANSLAKCEKNLVNVVLELRESDLSSKGIYKFFLSLYIVTEF